MIQTHATPRNHGCAPTAAQCSINTSHVAASVNSVCNTGAISSPSIAVKMSNSCTHNHSACTPFQPALVPVVMANRRCYHVCSPGPHAKSNAISMHATIVGAPVARDPTAERNHAVKPIQNPNCPNGPQHAVPATILRRCTCPVKSTATPSP